ncbi:MAG TPA: hypothetical protein VJ283_05560, partial [Trebonia sp.]|nr:hypothetical protein [Trebonia sp.]
LDAEPKRDDGGEALGERSGETIFVHGSRPYEYAFALLSLWHKSAVCEWALAALLVTVRGS